jgi:hypothetical protein
LSDKPPKAKFLIYLLSFIMPLVGLAIGMVYYLRPDADSRRFGKICLVIGVIAIILGCLSFLGWLGFVFFNIF